MNFRFIRRPCGSSRKQLPLQAISPVTQKRPPPQPMFTMAVKRVIILTLRPSDLSSTTLRSLQERKSRCIKAVKCLWDLAKNLETRCDQISSRIWLSASSVINWTAICVPIVSHLAAS